MNLLGIEGDEHVKGWSIRNTGSNAATTTQPIERFLTGDAKAVQWLVTTNLGAIAKTADGVCGTAEELLLRHTLWPVYLAFQEDEQRASMIRYAVAKQPDADSHPLKGACANAAFRLAWCVDCVREDERAAYPIWRREALIPDSAYCWWHKSRLSSPCNACIHIHSENMKPKSPGELCWCGRPLQAKRLTTGLESEEGNIVLSAVLADMLNSDFREEHSSNAIRRATVRRLIELDLVKSTLLNRPRLADLMVDRLGHQSLTMFGQYTLRGNSWFSEALGGGPYPQRPIMCATLVYLLWGGMAEFVQYLRSQDHSDVGDERIASQRRTTPGPAFEKRKIECRASLVQCMKQGDANHRIELEAFCRKELDWLRRNDREWLEETIARPKITPERITKRREKFDEVSRTTKEVQDQELVAHVREQAKVLKDPLAIPARITKATLTRSFRYCNQCRKDPGSFPEGWAEIESMLESEEAYAVRLVAWIESHRQELEQLGTDVTQLISVRLHIPRRDVWKLVNRTVRLRARPNN